jgi:hypothetical protein
MVIFWRDERRPHTTKADIPERDADGRPHAVELFWDTVQTVATDARRIALYHQGLHGQRLALWLTGMPTIQPRDEQLIDQVREQVAEGNARFVRNPEGRGNCA